MDDIVDQEAFDCVSQRPPSPRSRPREDTDAQTFKEINAGLMEEIRIQKLKQKDLILKLKIIDEEKSTIQAENSQLYQKDFTTMTKLADRQEHIVQLENQLQQCHYYNSDSFELQLDQQAKKFSAYCERLQQAHIANIERLTKDQSGLYKQTEDMKGELSKHKMIIKKLKEDKDKLLTRLSKVAGAKLTQGNAAITDLSDTNRPSKLAEQFSELYDNEWTDALEEINTHGKSEEEGTSILLNILKEANSLCEHFADHSMKDLSKAVTSLSTQTKKLTVKLDEEEKQLLYDVQRMFAPKMIMSAQESFLPQIGRVLQTIFGERNPTERNPRELFQTSLGMSQDAYRDQIPDQQISNQGEHFQFTLGQSEDATRVEMSEQQIVKQGSTVGDTGPNVKQKELKKNPLVNENTDFKLSSGRESCDEENAYILDNLPLVKFFGIKCVNLCWLMRIRDPPVYIDFDIKIGDTFDDTIYRAYTRAGPFIKFLVWPALYLENGGAMLSKGVAQGNLGHPDA